MNFNNIDFDTYFKNYPDANGYYGKYGGAYVSPELKKAMEDINEAYFTICKSSKFISELRRIRKEFQGRPTPVTHLERLSDFLGGKVQLYAFDTDAEIVSYIKKGIIACTVGQDSFGQGHDPIIWLYNHIAAEEEFPSDIIHCRVSVIDRSNVDSLII